MHNQAKQNLEKFILGHLQEFVGKKSKILDVGSLDVNGSLKPQILSRGWEYTGVDVVKGKNVDTVLVDPYKYPFQDNHFDIIISSSCFEHNEMFWLTFKEMVRITKSGGFMYISAPYKDGVHRVPVDCWRFLPDGYRALTKWCPESKLLESYIDVRPARDCVGIFSVTK